MPSVFARPNKFKGLSYHSNLNVDMGKLIPCYRQEVYPGDEFKVSADTIVRLMPMLAPIYGEINLWIHFFFVPYRLLWKNFEEFVTNGLENGVTNAVHPYITGAAYTTTGWEIGSLADYLGLPVNWNGAAHSLAGVKVNALPFRAYNKIYNDWYRNEFLDNERVIADTDGLDTTTDISLATRNWKRDYFTSALPFRQLGSPVSLPLGTTAPVVGTGKALGLTDGTTEYGLGSYNNGNTAYLEGWSGNVGLDNGTTSVGALPTGAIAMGVSKDGSKSNLVVDLSGATAATVNDLRTAFQLQRIMERKARNGNRYVEYISSTFGVRSPDARLQRAEFLGGGKATVMVSEVLQTSEGTSTSPQGQMTGHGFGASTTFAFNKAFVEHGIILGILSVMPKPSYHQGVPRDFIKDTWTDYYQPELAHLGEEAIYGEQVFSVANDNSRSVWAFQPMFQYLRTRPSEIHGDFRNNLNYWTLSRNFSSRPNFNAAFVDCDASGVQSNIFAAGVQAVRPVLIEMQYNVRAIRPLSKKGNPGYVDH